MVVLIDGASDCTQAVVAVGHSIRDRKFLKTACSCCLYDTDISDIVRNESVELNMEYPVIAFLAVRIQDLICDSPVPSRGFVYVRNSESLMDEAKTVLERTMEYCMDHNITDWGKIKNEVKDSLGDFVWKETKRRPMIMPIIMEV